MKTFEEFVNESEKLDESWSQELIEVGYYALLAALTIGVATLADFRKQIKTLKEIDEEKKTETVKLVTQAFDILDKYDISNDNAKEFMRVMKYGIVSRGMEVHDKALDGFKETLSQEDFEKINSIVEKLGILTDKETLEDKNKFKLFLNTFLDSALYVLSRRYR